MGKFFLRGAETRSHPQPLSQSWERGAIARYRRQGFSLIPLRGILRNADRALLLAIVKMLTPSPFVAIPQSRCARWALLKSAIADGYAPLGKLDGFSKKARSESRKKVRIQTAQSLERMVRAGRGARRHLEST
ncbi:MAG: hypothetical protein SW833_28150 [Cyanobacteriota bacterium]|nr:hypothetical protein [Cyanobacteriota bacterium]